MTTTSRGADNPQSAGSARAAAAGGLPYWFAWAVAGICALPLLAYLIKADLPGVDKKDIEVKLENGILSIRGEKKSEKETGKGTKQHRMERFHGSFARSFTLPEAVKADEVDASFKDGVLSLTIPKEEESKPKAIDIKVS